MKTKRFFWLLFVLVAFSYAGYGINSSSLPENIKYSFRVSMENPGTHYFQVELTCSEQNSDFVDFKMPVWTPGYYKIQNLSKNVVGFRATNGNGQPLAFHKTLKNTWRVNTKDEAKVVVSYDVYANELAVFGSYVDADKAFISPTGIFMFPDGQIGQPSLVTIKPYGNWKSISTGLDVVQDRPNTFFASNFDVLFDCPILVGNQQVIDFTVDNIPYSLAVSRKDTLDKTMFINDLKKIIHTTTSLMGDIPYKHYTFITIPSPGGGLEHSNSCVLSCTGSVSDTARTKGYKQWLSFVTHEYFHNYNVKSIRPVALGPFDYDKENYTNMLWVSEGITVYYEYLILNRAGILSRKECFDYLSGNIAAYENSPGHLFESATSSSFDAWIHYFDLSGDARNNTISYYDKGCALGLILDLKIREVSQNRKSLDDVMRDLYSTYYKNLKRGFTDEEFQSICEEMAGCPLTEIFNYAQTVDLIDYPKYLDMAGLTIDTLTHVIEGKAFLGASLANEHGSFCLHNVQRNSPAWKADLGNDLPVLAIDGQKVKNGVLDSLLIQKKAGETLTLSVKTDQGSKSVPVILTTAKQKKFTIEQKQNLNNLQKTILDSWLKD